MTNAESKREEAEKIGKGKAEFLRHLIAYGVANAVLALINNLTDPGGYQWWLWPAGGWGVFVLINFLSAYVFKTDTFKRLERRLAERELEKMDGGE